MVGAGFLAASVAVTRRSVVRLRTATVPPFYVSNRAPISSDDKGLIAVRALGLASLNVFSFGVMLVGGLSWAFDLSSVADLRERTRASLAAPLPGIKSGDEDEVERELDNMLDTLYDKLGMTRPDQEERYQRILLQKQHEEEQAVAASKDASEDGNTKA